MRDRPGGRELLEYTIASASGRRAALIWDEAAATEAAPIFPRIDLGDLDIPRSRGR